MEDVSGPPFKVQTWFSNQGHGFMVGQQDRSPGHHSTHTHTSIGHVYVPVGKASLR